MQTFDGGIQEMGDVGDEGDVVDEQLWGDDKDKPEHSKAEEKYEKDAPVQVSPSSCNQNDVFDQASWLS